MNHRTARRGAGPAAIVMALTVAAVSLPARAKEPASTFRWSVEVPGTGTLVIDLAPGWEPESTQRGDGLADWRASTRSHCEMTVRVVGSPLPDPAFNGPSALHDLVRNQAEALLPEAIEGRYDIQALRGPEAGGYYFALRERSPRRKQAYVTQGAVGLGNLRAEFTMRSPAPDLEEINQALKSLAAARLDREAVSGGKP
jgi:hypothetical protein